MAYGIPYARTTLLALNQWLPATLVCLAFLWIALKSGGKNGKGGCLMRNGSNGNFEQLADRCDGGVKDFSPCRVNYENRVCGCGERFTVLKGSGHSVCVTCKAAINRASTLRSYAGD